MPEAVDDLQSVSRYISRDSQSNAEHVVRGIFFFIEKQLTTFPKSGRAGKVFGTYDIKVPKLPFFVTYRIKSEATEILRVYHTSQLWPDSHG